MKKRNKIYTIGYEGVAHDELMAALHNAGIRVLVDIRRYDDRDNEGFSRDEIRAGCKQCKPKITYQVADELGLPQEGMDALDKEDYRHAWKIYDAAVDSPEAFCRFDEISNLAKKKKVCLFGFYADHRICHRHIAAGVIGKSKSSIFAFDIVNLLCNGQDALIP